MALRRIILDCFSHSVAWVSVVFRIYRNRFKCNSKLLENSVCAFLCINSNSIISCAIYLQPCPHTSHRIASNEKKGHLPLFPPEMFASVNNECHKCDRHSIDERFHSLCLYVNSLFFQNGNQSTNLPYNINQLMLKQKRDINEQSISIWSERNLNSSVSTLHKNYFVLNARRAFSLFFSSIYGKFDCAMC